ncbi:hypothetical protein [Desmospora activa]|uniref:Sigma-70-like protein n=1 Tax=Desmospora activa DSM 45169 TaxID=1121389 RepID=A0A2T4Z8Z4_9BACL|nr:hypothetical protein [Desmospora activa]PTM58362.1 hypothetical protein C8J48_0944 [Desmospora activa DSM 45169]
MTELYQDVCREIDVLEIRIRDLEMEYKFWYKACHRGGFPLDTCLGRMKDICDKVEHYSLILEQKEKARKEMEQRIAGFEGLEHRVAYMRDIAGKTLPEIAVELGYSYDWIKKLSARSKRKALRRHYKVESL